MNASFLTRLAVEILDDSKSQLIEPFRVQVDDTALEVPAGFVTDFYFLGFV